MKTTLTENTLAKYFAKAFREVLLPSLDNLATKDELKRLEDKMATKDDLKKLEDKMATKDELRYLRTDMNGRFDEMEVVLQKLLKTQDHHDVRI